MQKGTVLPLLLIVLSLMGGIFGYFYFKSLNYRQPPVTPSVSSKSKQYTYTNKQLGFEFKYSDKALTVEQDSEEEFFKRGGGNFRKNFLGYVGYEPGKFLGAVLVLDKTNSFDQNPLTVWVFDNPNDLDIDNWYKNYWYYPFVWGDFTYTGKSTLAPKEDATVSGQLGKFGIIDYQPGKPKFIYLSKDERSSRAPRTKKMYLFRIIGKAGDQILTSFKFIY